MLPDPVSAVDRELQQVKEIAGAPCGFRLGCCRISHERLGFCGGCVPQKGVLTGGSLELMGWRLLALREQA